LNDCLFIIENKNIEECYYLYRKQLAHNPNRQFRLSSDKKTLFISEERKRLICLDLTLMDEFNAWDPEKIKAEGFKIGESITINNQ